MPAKTGKILIVAALLLLIASFFLFDLGQYLSLEYIKSQQNLILENKQSQPILYAVLFFIVYVIATAVSFPGATLLTLLAGAIFGLFWGTILVSFASTIGASLAFIISRYLLRDTIQERFKQYIQPINDGIEREGAFYLFSIRLIFAFPFFIVNLLMGLTPIKLFTYFWVSQLGMLPATILYVNAGTQLASINSLSDIASPSIIFSFALLGVFPLIAKKGLAYIKEKYHVKKTN